MPKKQKRDSIKAEISLLAYEDLVEVVRQSKEELKINVAFEEIERRMAMKIKHISYRFTIPGMSSGDIYQEALFALRYKAIKDYDKTRGDGSGPYPFDKFAVLCIRRHLSTKLKASYQNKKKVWISLVSLDQDRNESSDDNLSLADIVPHTKGTILEALEKNEYFRNLIRKLLSKLSSFEKEVFQLYINKNSYDEISLKINSRLKSEKNYVNVKSIDNALSRIKHKAQTIFKKHGNE